MNSSSSPHYEPQDCDLIFQVGADTDFSKAITDATAAADDLKMDHVGMVIVEDGVPFVLEASSKKGVVLVPIADFLKRLPAGYVVKRITGEFDAQAAIERAKAHLGEPYDWSYLPDNGKMYCSELIYESFFYKNGTHIFTARPMNFRDSNGEMPQFWSDLFEKLGEKIPEGVLGTNPNDLSKESVLEEVWRELKSIKDVRQ